MEVLFNETVTNIDAADLRVNSVPATNLVALSPAQFRFEFPQPSTGAVSVCSRQGTVFAISRRRRTISPARHGITPSIPTRPCR